MGGKSENKAGYFDKLKGLLEEYSSIFIVAVDNVSSQQMHEIRHSLRGEGVVLMGKNTMVCMCIDTTKLLEVRTDSNIYPAIGSTCHQGLYHR
jgi:large subunit ribosomal protein LP0